MLTVRITLFLVFLSLLVGFSPAAKADSCVRMKTGKYKGQCLDTSHKRALKVIDQDVDTITVENFRKDGQFFKAIIPLNQIKSVSYLIIDLNAHPVNTFSLINISHTELRFRMNDEAPIELYKLDEPISAASFVGTESDFLISMNYLAPKGIIYNPVKGLDEDLYASVIQIFSTSDEVKTRFMGTQKFNMYEIPMDLNAEAGNVIEQAIFLSDTKQYDIPYDTWTSNCTTILFDLLDLGLNLKNQKPYRFSFFKMNDTGMIPGFKALGARGLVHDSTAIKLLNTEFGYKLFPSKSNRYFNGHVGTTYKDIK